MGSTMFLHRFPKTVPARAGGRNMLIRYPMKHTQISWRSLLGLIGSNIHFQWRRQMWCET